MKAIGCRVPFAKWPALGPFLGDAEDEMGDVHQKWGNLTNQWWFNSDLMGINGGLMGIKQWINGGLELEHGFYFSIYWECHHPNLLIFFRGAGIPPTSLTGKKCGFGQ